MQQQTLARGERQLNARVDDARVLDLELARLCRETEVLRRLIPHVPGLEERLLTLQAQLGAERLASERISAELESTTNEKRWRKLEGRDPEPEALVAKIGLLDERLDDKKEQLLEKELVLEEVSALAGRLRAQALERRDGTLELAKAVNEAQVRLKGVTRKMMAAVSELSMYQATSIKLTHDNASSHHALEACVRRARRAPARAVRACRRARLTRPARARAPASRRARRRFETGEAPTDEIEIEWQRYAATLDRRHDDAAAASAADPFAGGLGGSLVATTAEARPNAYIPDELGIPKPYGGNAPFKPSEHGSTMRHIRKPVLREIDI